MVTVDATTPQLKAVKGLVEALVSDNFKTIESFLSKDYVFKTFPITPELPDLTRNEYLQKYGAVIPLFAKAGVVFHEMIEAPGKVVTHLTLSFTTTDGNTVDYDSLLIITLVDEDGQLKAIEAKDFSDADKRRTFHDVALKVLGSVGTVA